MSTTAEPPMENRGNDAAPVQTATQESPSPGSPPSEPPRDKTAFDSSLDALEFRISDVEESLGDVSRLRSPGNITQDLEAAHAALGDMLLGPDGGPYGGPDVDRTLRRAQAVSRPLPSESAVRAIPARVRAVEEAAESVERAAPVLDGAWRELFKGDFAEKLRGATEMVEEFEKQTEEETKAVNHVLAQYHGLVEKVNARFAQLERDVATIEGRAGRKPA